MDVPPHNSVYLFMCWLGTGALHGCLGSSGCAPHHLFDHIMHTYVRQEPFRSSFRLRPFQNFDEERYTEDRTNEWAAAGGG